ncbi:MAG: DUF4468 domain-containing protein [Prevotella sp.]|nr:DUF4468 domain-containing protein [Prevotella sp.]
MRKIIVLLFAIFVTSNMLGQEKEYTIDKNNNIVVSAILESLPLNKHEIFTAARQYLTEAYKETKYKIVANNPENGTVAGEGMYSDFHEANYFPYAYFLNAPFILRVDAKDGRARLTITLTKYTGKRVNKNETIEINDRISDFPPINTREDDHKKLYTKAFSLLLSRSKDTLAELEKILKSTQSSNNLEQDW